MADKVVGNLTIRLDFDGAKFEQGMTQAKRELASYGKATKMSTSIARQDNYEKGKTVDALNNMQVRYKGLNSMVQVYAKENERLSKLEGDQTGKMAKNSQQMQNLQYEMYELNEEYKRFQKEAFTAQSAFTKVGNVAESVGTGMVRLGDGISQVGAGFTKVGTLASGSIGVVTKMAIDFENGMVQVQKTTNASADEMVVLERDIRNLALTMPLAVGELQNLAAIAGQLGIAQSDIAEFTEVMAKLGTATNISSEQASESMARFINITGSGVGELNNLGSALVHLGNNLATSESEIMSLSMGLAGSLTTVGASEYQIMGLAGAMSAMGITAERGASSMSKFFVDIASDVSNGSERLETFAKVSNMSVDQFVQAFQEDAVGAVQAFINGLGNVEDSGGDMLAVLEELDINEVRMRDTILRLANGHDILNESMELGKAGFEEGTALNEEYGTQLESTASQVELAKNQLYDLGITLGQELLPAVLDLLNNSDGLVDWLKESVDWFVNLDDEMKTNIVKWSAMSMVLGPVLSGFGNIVSGLGNMVLLFSTANKGIGKLSGALKSKLMPDLVEVTGGLATATTATTTLGDGAVAASGSGGVGSLITALAGSAGLPWALGIAGAALAGWTWWKVWGEDAYEASKRTQQWGTDVGEETDKVLTNFLDLSDEVKTATDSMADDAQRGGEKAVEGYAKMLEGITGAVDENTAEIKGFYDDLDTNTRNILEGSTNKQIEELEKTKANAEKYYGLINDIYAGAMEENRELTEGEIKRVELYHKKLAELQAEAVGGTEEQIRNTRNVLYENLKGMSEEQLALRSVYLQQDLDNLKENTEEQLAILDEQHAAGNIKEQEYQEAKLSMKQAYNREVQALLDEEIKAYLARGEEESTIIALLKDRYKDYGYTREDIEQRVQTVLKGTQDDMAEADRLWENLLKDPITGEINTNIPETIADMAQSEETWEQLHFMIHNADIDTNAKATVADWIEASGYWDQLDPETKEFLGDAQNFIAEVEKSEEWLNRWDSLPEEDKRILGDNYDILLKLTKSEEAYQKWMDLPEEDKEILGNNSDLLKKILSSEKEYNRWLKLPEKEKKLLANNSQVFTAVDNAQRKINSLRGKSVTLTTRKQTIYETFRRAGNSSSSQKFANSGGQILHDERGTNFHPGGLAMVNDQSGNLFRELVTLPSGEQFVPEGRNVLLDLPKGSKVLRSALTKHMFPDLPQYAQGSGLQTTTVPKGFGEMKTTDNSSNDTYNIYITANGDLPDLTIRKMAERIEREIKNSNDRKRSSRGERVVFG